MSPTAQAIILLSRGGYSHAPQKQLSHLVASLQSARPDTLVLGAMVDKEQPSLPDALQACAETGIQRITVLPVFLPADYNLQRWLAKVIRRWYSQWSGSTIKICLAESLGDHSAFQTSVTHAVENIQPYIRDVCESPPNNWESDPTGWSNIPDHAYHLFFCQGPRCTALGASKLAAHLRKELKAQKLTRDDRVLVAQTGCLYPCNLGPMMVVYPDGVWYGGLTANALDQIVEEHFVGGQPVKEYSHYSEANRTLS